MSYITHDNDGILLFRSNRRENDGNFVDAIIQQAVEEEPLFAKGAIEGRTYFSVREFGVIPPLKGDFQITAPFDSGIIP